MRNYWVKIALGALAVFAIGMMGVALARRGIHRAQTVANSNDPISIPLAFIPFKLAGQRLGTLRNLTLERDSPQRVSQVRLTVELADSAALARLGHCRVAADFDWDRSPNGVSVSREHYDRGTFRCVPQDSTAAGMLQYGSVTFEPADLTVPLLLPQSAVNDLRKGDFGDSAVDSITTVAEQRADSLTSAAERRADSLEAMGDSLASSLEERSARRADSIRTAVQHAVDSIRAGR